MNNDLEKMRRDKDGGGCAFACLGRGDCESAVGLPGKSIPGQHDGLDDTVDAYGKPNGWCWSCWKSRRINDLEVALGNAMTELGVRANRLARERAQHTETRELVRQACIDHSEYVSDVVKYGEYSEEGDCTDYILPKELPNIPKLEQDLNEAQASEKHLRDLLAAERGNAGVIPAMENNHE